MARTRSSKSKAKVAAGNPDFNISEVTPSSTIATSAVTAEDLAFDRELERLGSEMPPVIDDPVPASAIVKVEKPTREMLGDAVENYKPATNDLELREQIHTAKMHDCDSIEATLGLAKRFCRDPKLEEVGYFLMHDIKVYIVGAFEKSKARDRQTCEQRNFGGSTVA